MRDEPPGFYCGICTREFPDSEYEKHVPPHKPFPADKLVMGKLDPEDTTFIPEVSVDPESGEKTDVATGRKYRKPFSQAPYKPLTDYEG